MYLYSSRGHSGGYVYALTGLREMFFPLLHIRRPLASSPHLLLHVIRLYSLGLCTTTFLNPNLLPRLCVLLYFHSCLSLMPPVSFTYSSKLSSSVDTITTGFPQCRWCTYCSRNQQYCFKTLWKANHSGMR